MALDGCQHMSRLNTKRAPIYHVGQIISKNIYPEKILIEMLATWFV